MQVEQPVAVMQWIQQTDRPTDRPDADEHDMLHSYCVNCMQFVETSCEKCKHVCKHSQIGPVWQETPSFCLILLGVCVWGGGGLGSVRIPAWH